MTEGWKRKSLADLLEFRNGINFTQASHGEQIKVVGVGDFRDKEVLNDFSGMTSVTLNGNVSASDLLENNDLLFVRSNGNKALIGRCVLISEIAEPVSFSGFTIRGRVKSDEVDHSFASKLVRSPLFKEHLHRMGGGSSINNLSQDTLSAFCFSLPTLPEQRKIAQILRTWDEAIEKLENLEALYRRRYLALRNRLIRWEDADRKRLKDILQPVSRPVPRPESAYLALSVRSHGKGAYVRAVDDPSTVDMDTLYIAKAGDLIVNITFAWEGAIAMVRDEMDGCLVSHRFPTFVPKDRRINTNYLRHVVRMPRFTNLLQLVSPGGAGRNRVLNKKDFLELEIPCPPLSYQDKIADILHVAELSVSTADSLKAEIQAQKRGLMQRLLTGDWRVPC